MGKVKRELGTDAVILQTREFREGGVLGFFGKVKVEITAAIEEKPVMINKIIPKELPVEKEPREPKAPVIQTSPNENDQASELQRELKTMRKILEKMTKQMENPNQEQQTWNPLFQNWADHLQNRGINEQLIKRLLIQVQQTLPESEWSNNEKVFARIEASVRQICGQTGPIQPGLDKPRVVALIGPTGVGKTTTIGKLAAGFSIVDKRKVALITADTYRVAAVEQLKTFGEIIGVPVEVVMTPEGLQDALSIHADKELIFIDTAGRSPHHDLHMSQLQAFLDTARPDFTMLVMSATTQFPDQLQIYQRFEALTTHLIFTKLDETSCAGAILNLLGQTTLPTAYLTNGQNVPDDIEAATPNRLAGYVLGEEMPHA
jgi:flagellar biosynthesis protein FlhF